MAPRTFFLLLLAAGCSHPVVEPQAAPAPVARDFSRDLPVWQLVLATMARADSVRPDSSPFLKVLALPPGTVRTPFLEAWLAAAAKTYQFDSVVTADRGLLCQLRAPARSVTLEPVSWQQDGSAHVSFRVSGSWPSNPRGRSKGRNLVGGATYSGTADSSDAGWHWGRWKPSVDPSAHPGEVGGTIFSDGSC